MDPLNAEQVLALAPDTAVAQAGRNLSHPARWLSLGRDASLLWGETQGSGAAAEPCRTHVGLAGAAPSCSCRSRKQPCKHALGLLLLFAANPARVPEIATPAWVQIRQAKRVGTVRQDGSPAVPGEGSGGPAVLEELQAWLSGLIAEGLGHARQQPAQFFEAMAARLAAAQTPGLARRLRTWPALFSADTPEWAEHALEETGDLQLLLNSAGRLDEMPAGARASVCAALGWPADEKTLLAAGGTGAETVTDTWLSVGRRTEQNGGARVRRTWLLGRRTGRAAMCSSPEDGQRAPDAAFVPGAAFEADLLFYPGPMPLRARVQARRGGESDTSNNARIEPAGLPAALADFAVALERSAAVLAADPWAEPTPWFVANCVPVVRHTGETNGRTTAHWSLRDGTDAAVPLPADFPGAWQLLAASGGAPVSVFGEWDGHTLLPLSVIADGRFIDLAVTAGAATGTAGHAAGGNIP